jgi:hypothetical protein
MWPSAFVKHLCLPSRVIATQLAQAPDTNFCELQNEQDLSTRRNAFQFLTQHDQQRAINYLLGQVLCDPQPCRNPCSLCWHCQRGALHAVQAVWC